MAGGVGVAGGLVDGSRSSGCGDEDIRRNYRYNKKDRKKSQTERKEEAESLEDATQGRLRKRGTSSHGLWEDNYFE